jgi:hypothetical protein
MKTLTRAFDARLARACHAMAKFVGRLLAAMLVGHIFLLASAQANFPAQALYTAYSIRSPFHVAWGPGAMPDASACIAMYADWNAEIQSCICSHYAINPFGLGKTYESVWLQQTTNVCPANSTANAPNGAWCNCNAGFVQQANTRLGHVSAAEFLEGIWPMVKLEYVEKITKKKTGSDVKSGCIDRRL